MPRVAPHTDRAAVLRRILAAWDREPKLRLGQLLMASVGWQSLPHVEDEALATRVEEFVAAVDRLEKATARLGKGGER